MTDYRGRVILITGAASGIGQELARLFSAEGALIAAIDRDEAGLERLRSGLPAIHTAVADVTDVVALREAVSHLESIAGPIDTAIASAGIGRGTPAMAWKAEEVNAVLQVNLLGVVNTIDAVLAGMRQRKSGHLVVLSSLASYRGLPHMAAYSASKAGCNALCDSLRVELADEGVAVSCICPGWIHTPMTASLGIPAGMMMAVEPASARILAAIRQRRRFTAFPSSTAWLVWLLRSLPRPMGDWLAGRMLRRVRKLQERRIET
jgi:NAD(P)-dependent dehydrogenase (short-subunit alcohol dehydrogenase family)